MKKVLALVLALAMAFAVCVPAFAEVTKVDGKWEVKDNVSQTDPVKAKIHTTKELPTGTYAYEISIPADTEIKWGATETSFNYEIIKTQLEAGKRLQIAVKSQYLADHPTEQRSLTSATAPGYAIPYTYGKSNDDGSYTPVDSLSYTTEKEVTGLNQRSFSINITTDAWKVPLATYEDQLNFVIDIVDAPVVEP